MKRPQAGHSILTFEAIAEQYPPTKFILLLPQVSRHLLTTVPMWSLDVATVKVDPGSKAEAYEIGYQSGDFGLTKSSLDALATAADLTVIAKRIDNRADRLLAEYEAHALMTTPSGGMRGQGRTCEWDGRTQQEKCQEDARSWFDDQTGKPQEDWRLQKVPGGQKKDVRLMAPAEREAVIDRRYRRNWIRAQEFGKRMTESKAANRAIRSLLGILPKYGFEELSQKEFAIVRFVFTPDLDDREVKLMVVGAGLEAQRSLYPGAGSQSQQLVTQSALPAPVTEPPMQLVEGQDSMDDPQAPPEAEVEDESWDDVKSMVPDVAAMIPLLKDAKNLRAVSKRFATAIANRDAGQLNKIMDFLVMETEGGDPDAE